MEHKNNKGILIAVTTIGIVIVGLLIALLCVTVNGKSDSKRTAHYSSKIEAISKECGIPTKTDKENGEYIAEILELDNAAGKAQYQCLTHFVPKQVGLKANNNHEVEDITLDGHQYMWWSGCSDGSSGCRLRFNMRER